MLSLEDRILRLELLAGVAELPKEIINLAQQFREERQLGFYDARKLAIKEYFKTKEKEKS